MSRAIVRTGRDAHVRSDRPAANFGQTKVLRVDSAEAYAFLYFNITPPVPRGATVLSATLRVHEYNEWPETPTLNVMRVAGPWKARTVTWNNKPGVVSGTSVNGVAGPDAPGPAGRVWEFDVTAHAQSIVDGAKNYGWRITTSNTTARLLRGLTADFRKPTLTIRWSDRPAQPTTLRPDGAAFAGTHPILRFDFTDVSGSTELNKIHVQIDANQAWTAPAFEYGPTAADVPELDLSQTTYPGLSSGTTYWRVRVQDEAGLWSDWSDAASWSYDQKGTVEITNPASAPDDVVWEPTPTFTWAFTGETQAAYRLQIRDAAEPSKILYDSQKIRSVETAHELPRGVIVDEEQYIVRVFVWDDKDRVGVPGNPTWVSAQRSFTFDFDATVEGPDWLTADQDVASPWVDLKWDIASAPDSWTIVRDNKIIAVVEPQDTIVPGSTVHTWRDWTATPQRLHRYRVAANRNKRTSKNDPTVAIIPTIKGVWLGDPEAGTEVMLLGSDEVAGVFGEQAETYITLGAAQVTRVVSARRGLEGAVTGLLASGFGREATDIHKAIMTLNDTPELVVRLVWGDLNIPVVTDVINSLPVRRLTRPEKPVHTVTFNFWQSGELPFRPRL